MSHTASIIQINGNDHSLFQIQFMSLFFKSKVRSVKDFEKQQLNLNNFARKSVINHDTFQNRTIQNKVNEFEKMIYQPSAVKQKMSAHSS